MKALSVAAAIIFTASSWNALATSPPIDNASDASPSESSLEDSSHAGHGLHFMFTLGSSEVAGYTLGSTAATPLPGSPYTLNLSAIRTVGDASVLTMALADNYLYVLATEPGSVGDMYLSYSVSSTGLTYVGSGGAPPQAFDRSTVAMIPNANAHKIYFVSARDSTISTIATGESYLDIARAKKGALREDASGSIPLDNCGAQSANLDVATSQLLVSCAPGSGTPTALIIPLAVPTTAITVTIPTPTSGTVGKSLLVDGYLYVVVNGMLLPNIGNGHVPTDVVRAGSGISDTGIRGFLSGHDRREVHAKAKT